jgi:hypothetical protein
MYKSYPLSKARIVLGTKYNNFIEWLGSDYMEGDTECLYNDLLDFIAYDDSVSIAE